jgi:hypothetical protein
MTAALLSRFGPILEMEHLSMFISTVFGREVQIRLGINHMKISRELSHQNGMIKQRKKSMKNAMA